MPRLDLYLPPGTTVETTTRTLCGMFLLPATPYFAKIVVGVFARAQEKYPVKIHFGSMLTNNYHLILTPDDREQLADFMEFVNGNLAREVLVLVEDWDEKCWGDRYHPIPITNEPEALEARLRYAISNGVKVCLSRRTTKRRRSCSAAGGTSSSPAGAFRRDSPSFGPVRSSKRSGTAVSRSCDPTRYV